MTEEWKKGEWTTVAIPRNLKEKLDKLLKDYPFYRSSAEFIRDAIRDKMISVQRQIEIDKEMEEERK